MIFIRDKVRLATEKEKIYVKSLSKFAIEETIETDGLSFFWSEPGSQARYSADVFPIKERREEI